MSQQHMDFEQAVPEDNTKSYSSGYEESPYQYPYRAGGQKISKQDEGMNFTAFQRFVLAILSLSLFAGLCVIFIILALVIPAASSVSFAPVLGGMGFFFMILLIVVNVLANRKH